MSDFDVSGFPTTMGQMHVEGFRLQLLLLLHTI